MNEVILELIVVPVPKQKPWESEFCSYQQNNNNKIIMIFKNPLSYSAVCFGEIDNWNANINAYYKALIIEAVR